MKSKKQLPKWAGLALAGLIPEHKLERLREIDRQNHLPDFVKQKQLDTPNLTADELLKKLNP